MTLKATKYMAEFAQKCTHRIFGFNLHRQGAALLPNAVAGPNSLHSALRTLYFTAAPACAAAAD